MSSRVGNIPFTQSKNRLVQETGLLCVKLSFFQVASRNDIGNVLTRIHTNKKDLARSVISK